jgi:hypothetical protein
MKYLGLMIAVMFLFNTAWIILRVVTDKNSSINLLIYRAIVNSVILIASLLVCVITYCMQESNYVGIICTLAYLITQVLMIYKGYISKQSLDLDLRNILIFKDF